MINYELDGRTVQLPDDLWESLKKLSSSCVSNIVSAWLAPCTPNTPMYSYPEGKTTYTIPMELYKLVGPTPWQIGKIIMQTWVRDHSERSAFPEYGEVKPLTEVLRESR